MVPVTETLDTVKH